LAEARSAESEEAEYARFLERKVAELQGALSQAEGALESARAKREAWAEGQERAVAAALVTERRRHVAEVDSLKEALAGAQREKEGLLTSLEEMGRALEQQREERDAIVGRLAAEKADMVGELMDGCGGVGCASGLLGAAALLEPVLADAAYVSVASADVAVAGDVAVVSDLADGGTTAAEVALEGGSYGVGRKFSQRLLLRGVKPSLQPLKLTPLSPLLQLLQLLHLLQLLQLLHLLQLLQLLHLLQLLPLLHLLQLLPLLHLLQLLPLLHLLQLLPLLHLLQLLPLLHLLQLLPLLHLLQLLPLLHLLQLLPLLHLLQMLPLLQLLQLGIGLAAEGATAQLLETAGAGAGAGAGARGMTESVAPGAGGEVREHGKRSGFRRTYFQGQEPGAEG
ncbi:hypothetical protein CLOM_g17078, partial [Closterium sp. NIES-68]